MLADFHHRAAIGDLEGYFGHFDEQGVFLGTDGTERWLVPEFREFARPHFADGSGWTFVPGTQNITIARDGSFAWFDEDLSSASYGACRGSGVAIRTGEGWKIGQYNLSVPIPNDLLRDFVARIRGEANTATQIILVRHAEKNLDGGADPELTELGRRRAESLAALFREVELAAIFTTPYARTQSTAAPIAASRKLTPIVVPANDVSQLAERIKNEFSGKRVLYVGHSNTVPTLIRALGVETEVSIDDAAYDNVFVVTLDSGSTPALLRLHPN